MTVLEIQYKVEHAKEALEKCFGYLGESPPNLFEAEYCLQHAVIELKEAKRPLSDLADKAEQE